MRFADIKTSVQARLQDDTSEVVVELNNWVNWAIRDLSRGARLPVLRREDRFFTIPEYTTGTLTATDGSATLTGASTTWTAEMVGRTVRVNGEAATYVVKTFSSATSIVLETPYQGDGGAGLTYTIYPLTYRLRDDVDVLISARHPSSSGPLLIADLNDLDLGYPNNDLFGTPDSFIFVGSTETSFYSTGTAAVSNGSPTVTLTTGVPRASFVGKSFAVDTDVNSYRYRITAVSGATMTIEPVYKGANASGLAYTIDPPPVKLITLRPLPTEQAQVIYRYYRVHPRLVDDNEQSLLPPEWDEAIILGALTKAHTFFQSEYADVVAKVSDEYQQVKAALRRQLHQEPAHEIHAMQTFVGGSCSRGPRPRNANGLRW